MTRLIIFALILSPSTVFGFGDTLVIVHDRFAHTPFGSELTTKDIQNRWNIRFILEKEAIKNAHSQESDTLLIFIYKSSKLVFYKAKNRTLLQEAIIADPEITLTKQICVGATKESFLKFFNEETDAPEDYIIVTNETEYAHHHFIFEDGLLKKIILQMGVD